MSGAARAWWIAVRPKTLAAAIAPVLIGTAMAWVDGGFHWLAASAALVGALLLQILANFANDYFDFVKGADDPSRIGPTRAVASGLVTPRAMRIAMALVVVAMVPIAAYLVWRAGPVFAVIAVLGVVFAILYTGGPRPLAYVGLGDVAAFVFFGPVAVAGTYAAQALHFAWPPAIAGAGTGCLAVALLAVNNLRDREGDARAGKRTLAVRFGDRFARAEIFACTLTAALVPALLATRDGRWWALLATVACATLAPQLAQIVGGLRGPALNGVLAATGRTLAAYGLAFSIGWVVG